MDQKIKGMIIIIKIIKDKIWNINQKNFSVK
jgi:hypothetical protein